MVVFVKTQNIRPNRTICWIWIVFVGWCIWCKLDQRNYLGAIVIAKLKQTKKKIKAKKRSNCKSNSRFDCK